MEGSIVLCCILGGRRERLGRHSSWLSWCHATDERASAQSPCYKKKAVPLCIKLSRSTRGRVFACSAGSARFFSPLIYTGEPLRKHTHNDGRKQKHVPCILHNPVDSSPSETRFPSLTHYENLDLLLPSAFFLQEPGRGFADLLPCPNTLPLPHPL